LCTLLSIHPIVVLLPQQLFHHLLVLLLLCVSLSFSLCLCVCLVSSSCSLAVAVSSGTGAAAIGGVAKQAPASSRDFCFFLSLSVSFCMLCMLSSLCLLLACEPLVCRCVELVLYRSWAPPSPYSHCSLLVESDTSVHVIMSLCRSICCFDIFLRSTMACYRVSRSHVVFPE
jgi:hypothetical protein